MTPGCPESAPGPRRRPVQAPEPLPAPYTSDRTSSALRKRRYKHPDALTEASPQLEHHVSKIEREKGLSGHPHG